MKFNSLTSFLNLAFAMVLFIQSSAWATGKVVSPEALARIGKFVEHYNSLSENGKREHIKKLMKMRPTADQKIFAEHQKSFMKLSFPELRLKGESISFNYEGKEHSLKFKTDQVISVGGSDIDFGPGKLSEATTKLEEIYRQNKTSFVDFFISSAHADPVSILIGGAIILLISFAATLVMIAMEEVYFMIYKQELICGEMRLKADQLKHHGSPADISKVRKHLKKELKSLKDSSECNPKWARSGPYKICTDAMKCLEEISDELEVKPDAVNSSGREEVEETSGSSSRGEIIKKSNEQ